MALDGRMLMMTTTRSRCAGVVLVIVRLSIWPRPLEDWLGVIKEKRQNGAGDWKVKVNIHGVSSVVLPGYICSNVITVR